MSHVVSIKTEVKDLDAIKAACAELGLVFKEGQKTIRWFGEWMNDYDAADAAYKLGIDPKSYGTCHHAIEVPGSEYDVGLLRNEATGGYRIYFDFYGCNGQKIQQAIGESGGKLVQAYAAQVTANAYRAKGFSVTKTVAANGHVKLQVVGFKG